MLTTKEHTLYVAHMLTKVYHSVHHTLNKRPPLIYIFPLHIFDGAITQIRVKLYFCEFRSVSLNEGICSQCHVPISNFYLILISSVLNEPYACHCDTGINKDFNQVCFKEVVMIVVLAVISWIGLIQQAGKHDEFFDLIILHSEKIDF